MVRPCAWRGLTVGQQVVHFEIMFGWEFQIGAAATEAVSQSGNYGMAPQEGDGDRDGGDGRHDEQRRDDAAHNGGAGAH